MGLSTAEATEVATAQNIVQEPNYNSDDTYLIVVNDWMKASHDLMNYSWIQSINNSVLSAQQAEIASTSTSISEVGNHIMKAKYMNLMTRRDTEKLAAKSRLIRRTMVAVSVAALVVEARWLGSWRQLLLAVIALSYTVYATLSIKMTRARRYDDYGTIYFNESSVSTARSASATNDSVSQQNCNV